MPASTAAHQLCFAYHANACEKMILNLSTLCPVSVFGFFYSYCCGNVHRTLHALSNLPKQNFLTFLYLQEQTLEVGNIEKAAEAEIQAGLWG